MQEPKHCCRVGTRFGSTPIMRADEPTEAQRCSMNSMWLQISTLRRMTARFTSRSFPAPSRRTATCSIAPPLDAAPLTSTARCRLSAICPRNVRERGETSGNQTTSAETVARRKYALNRLIVTKRHLTRSPHTGVQVPFDTRYRRLQGLRFRTFSGRPTGPIPFHAVIVVRRLPLIDLLVQVIVVDDRFVTAFRSNSA
jgi:hypothetical protein